MSANILGMLAMSSVTSKIHTCTALNRLECWTTRLPQEAPDTDWPDLETQFLHSFRASDEASRIVKLRMSDEDKLAMEDADQELVVSFTALLRSL